MKRQAGYTLVELLICLLFLVAIAAAGAVIWVAIHFISKLW